MKTHRPVWPQARLARGHKHVLPGGMVVWAGNPTSGWSTSQVACWFCGWLGLGALRVGLDPCWDSHGLFCANFPARFQNSRNRLRVVLQNSREGVTFFAVVIVAQEGVFEGDSCENAPNCLRNSRKGVTEFPQTITGSVTQPFAMPP